MNHNARLWDNGGRGREIGMCYSPEADLIAGVAIGAIAIDGIRHTKHRRSMLALATIPAVLAAHQLIEAFAWWGLQGRVASELGEFAAATYLVIAFGVVPILVPYAVLRVEPRASRRHAMLPFVLLGVAVASVLIIGLATVPHTASVGGRYISYSVAIPRGGLVTLLYGTAVCTPLLLSSTRRIAMFGALNVPVFVALSVLLGAGLISLWCVWAAATSVTIAVHLRATARVPNRQESSPLTARFG